jgi:alpha-L-rhamnosidase
MTISKLRTNHLTNPIGYAFDPPSVSWVTDIPSAKKQASAQVLVFKGRTPDTSVLSFDSGQRTDISSLGYELPLTLDPCTRYFWKVKIWTETGIELESDFAFFETAKMSQPWRAVWIRSDFQGPSVLRKEFTVPSAIQWSRAYISALGVYEVSINGRKVGNEYLMPGFHSYNCFVEYQTYEIEEYL